MFKPIQWQPHRAIVILAMMVALTLIALVAYDLQRERSLAIEAAGAKTRDLSQLLEEHARQSMRRAELTLSQAFDETAETQLSDPKAREDLRKRLMVHVPKDQLVGSFAVIGKDGRILVSTAADRVELLPAVGDRDFFLAHQGGFNGLFVGAAVKSRVSEKWIIPVSMGRWSPQGNFDGVVMATLDPGYFQSFYDSIDVGTNGFVTLFSREAWALARSPFVEKVALRNWADSPMFTEHLRFTPRDTVRQVVVADGVERIYSYRQLKDYPLIVSIGVSLTDGLAPWRERLVIVLAFLGVVLTALGFATWLLAKQWREHLKMQHALSLNQFSVQKASLATFWIASDSRILRVNEAACDLHGYTQAELLSMAITDLDPDFPAERWPLHWAELREKRNMLFETTHKARDGSIVPIEVELNFIEFDGEEYNFAFMRDISQRLKAEDKIRRGERMLRDAIDAVDEAFVLFDPQDRLVYCNDKYRYLYPGMEHLMVPGTPFEDLVRIGAQLGMYEESVGNEEDWIRARIQAHRDGQTVRVQKRGDGQVLRVIDRKTADGHTVGFRVDITEMVRATEAAQEASRYKSQFLANMSHEIRTPMNAILGLLRLLQNTPLNAQQKDYANKTDSAAKSLLGLLNDILDFSKVEAGKMSLDPHPFQLDRLLRDVSVVLSTNVGTKPIDVLFELDPALPRFLVGDAMRLQQVLVNLGGNAVKFTHEGTVQLRVRKSADAGAAEAPEAVIEFSVQDSGIGIDAEDQERVFTGFSQAEASTTRRFGGTGLGLAICRRLVELMGGELTLRSALGAGSTFTFSLQMPVLQQFPEDRPDANPDQPQMQALASPPLPGATRQLTGLRILVVEDNLINQQVAQELLTLEGAEVTLAANGALGVQAVADAQPQFDVVLMDIQMPELDGYGATARIRNELGLQDLPIIAMTANAMASDRMACLAAGMNDHIGKPFDMAHLVYVLLRMVGREVAPQNFAPRAAPGPMSEAPAAVELPFLDVQAALARLSGRKPIYLRVAREFDQSLASVVAQYRESAQKASLAELAAQMHTLKGTAATFGAMALSAHAAGLEKLCRRQETDFVALDHVAALESMVAATHGALAQAITELAAEISPEPAARAEPLEKPRLGPRKLGKIRLALHEIEALIAANDLTVLERLGALRDLLADCPGGHLPELESALEALDLCAAQRACKAMAESL